MKNLNKLKNIIVILVLLLMLVYLVNNRTKNVFEEIYYSENPSIIKAGITNTSLLSVRECYRGNKTLETDLGQKIYVMKLYDNIDATIYFKKNQYISLDVFFDNKDYYMCVFCEYNLQEKAVHLSTILEDTVTKKTVSNVEEVISQLLSEYEIEANSLKEVSDIILKDFLNQWFEGNSMSVFSMDDLGDFEIVYE